MEIKSLRTAAVTACGGGMLTLALAGCYNNTDAASSPQPTASPTTAAPTTPAPATTAPGQTGGVTPTQLYSAPVPSLCHHPAGRLVNGALPGIPESQGFVALRATLDKAHPDISSGDLNGDGKPDAAATFDCSGGGVSWPESVVLYDDQLRIIGSVNLGQYSSAEHASVDTLTVKYQNLIMKWSTNYGANACVKNYLSNVRLVNGQAKVENVQRLGRASGGCPPGKG